MNRRPNIWKFQADRDIKGLTKALDYPDPNIRKRAAAALRVLGAREAISSLNRALLKEPNPDVKEHINAALEHLDYDSFVTQVVEERNVDDLIALLKTGSPEDIIRASKTLGEIGDRLATEPLVMVFRNPLMSDEIRLAAAEALLALQSATSVVSLLGGLKKENWRVRHNAATVLGQLKALWATKPLIEALDDDHPSVRRAAAASLQRFQTPQSIEALRSYKAKERQRQTGALRPEVVEEAEAAAAPAKVQEEPKEHVQVGSADQERDTMTMRPVGLDKLLRNKDKQSQSVEKKADSNSPDDPPKSVGVGTKPLSTKELNIGSAAVPESKRDTRPSGGSQSTSTATD